MKRYGWVLIVLGISALLYIVAGGFFLDYAVLTHNPEVIAADAEGATAIGTLLLAAVTAVAIIVPILERAHDEKTAKAELDAERIAVLRHLLHIVDVFQRRIMMWSTRSYNGDALMDGLDVALQSALSNEVIKVLGPTGTSTIAVRNIINAYNQMVTRRFDAQTGGPSHVNFQLTSNSLVETADALKNELKTKYGVDPD